MDMISLRRAKIDEVRAGLEPMFRLHWEEIALHKDVAPLSPNWEYYYAAERSGRLITIIADDCAKIVGYNVYFLRDMIHNYPRVVAENDVLYISPEYRRGSLAARMLSFGENEAKRRGACIVTMHVKKEHDFSSMLIRSGYDENEILLSKEL